MTIRTRSRPAAAHAVRTRRAGLCGARWPLVALLALLLAACADIPLPVSGPGAQADAEHAEDLYRGGDLDQAANAFLELARRHRGDEAAHYRLRAAEALRDRGDLDGAAHALGDIRRRRLHGDEPLRLDLLDAEIALRRGDNAQALALLAGGDRELPPDLHVRFLELRARAALAAGDAFEAAHLRATLDRLLAGSDREQNRRQLLDALSRSDPANVRTRVDALPPDDPLRPWIEQLLRGQGQAMARALPRPDHPVGTLRPNADGHMQAEGYAPPHHVALLLPLNAQLASVSQSIRDGFLSAYFADEPTRRPDVRIYDSGRTPADAVAAYGKAVADGADRVVGPLQREAVGELFHHSLPAPVLALNHPDTGEVPPPGSAEFGLLPDAEGAQVAARMRTRGFARVAVIAADADWADRAARAFRAQFEADGGSIVGEARIGDKDVNYASAIRQAAGSLGDAGDAGDGGVFISMRPQQARLLLPQLRVAGIRTPVFATSHVYSGDRNPTLDRDLDGVEFCDAPWLLGPVTGLPDRAQVGSRLDSASGVGGRLFAFGLDAYDLLPYVDWLLAHPESYLDGATGALTADSFGRVHRIVGWARFTDGVAVPVEGALSPTPLAQ